MHNYLRFFFLLAALLLVPSWSAKGENYPSVSNKVLEQVIYWFTTRPAEMIYIEDQEYIQTGTFSLRKHFVFRFKKKEEHGQITHLKYLEGDRHTGKAATGGLVVYNKPYPFLPSERPKYQFLQKSASEIIFFPKVEDQLLYAGVLTISKKGVPQKLELIPRFRFPSLDYYFKEVIFEVDQNRLLEKYIEIHGAFYPAPFFRRAIRYKLLRFGYKFANLTWK